MEAYYTRQASIPHFTAHYGQRGREFSALAAGMGRFALPSARKVIWPAATLIDKELFTQSAPEIADVITKKSQAGTLYYGQENNKNIWVAVELQKRGRSEHP